MCSFSGRQQFAESAAGALNRCRRGADEGCELMGLVNALRIGIPVFFWGLLVLVGTGPVRAQTGPEERDRATYSDAEFDALMTRIDTALGRDPAPERPPTPAVVGATSSDAVAEPAGADGATLRARIESGLVHALERARRHLSGEPRRVLVDLLAGKASREVEFTLLGLLGVLLVTWLALRTLRGRGDLAVSIHYPAELRGTFNVRIAKRRSRRHANKRVANAPDAMRIKRRAISATRFEHTMVARETHFRDLLARRYSVMVYGFLQALEGEDVIETHLEEQEVRIRRGRTARLDFDFHPKECVVEVRVLWDRKPAAEALLALRGHPDSLRYARGGPARMGVPQGTHVLVVGSGDRVTEHALEITSFQPHSVEIDLTGRDDVLFSGCPPAVEPYLHGDVPAAARALERDGQIEVSHLILARLHRELGQDETAAHHYEAADRPIDAAEIHQALGHAASAAALFERAGESARAAEMWRTAGELSRAGEAYERANRVDAAVECYSEAGDISRWTSALERNGEPLAAARVSIERDDWGRAIRSLQQVMLSDSDYVAATNLLIDAYQNAGHLDLALHKTEELVHNQGIDEVPLESCSRLADLLEESGELERSLGVLQIIRRRDATYPNVATRIEELRKRVNEDATTGAASNPGNAFGGESRYEIVGELGRGGMGIVFRARDRRLGRVVALKQLPENLRNHPKAVQLFLREARSAAALNHPNIVTVYDAGQENGILYITMELLEGMPLQVILKRRGQLTPRDAARLGVQIANGLQYAHEQRIIHRDIKTGNLFFTNSKKVKIMDFGLAKMVEEVRKASTVIGGTPYYMAPEQSLGGAVDHRADLYAFGVTLFELTTGTVPFTEGDVAYHHRHTTPTDPRERVEELPADFAELILELLAKSPDARCESALEVSERLSAIAKALS